MEKFKDLLEETSWKEVKSIRKGDNKGNTILVFKDGKDFVEIARTAEDEYSVAAYWNKGDSDLIDYEFNLKDFDSEYHKRLSDNIPNVPKFSKKMLKSLDILNNKEDDWGTV